MSLRKKLTGLAFMVACCFGKSAHAGGFWDSSCPSSPNVTPSEFNMTSLGVVRDLPSEMTGLEFYMPLAEKLWQQAYANSGSSAESFQTLEAPLRAALIQRLIQAQPPQAQSGQTPDEIEIAHAQFIVTQIQRALEVLREEVQRGIDSDNAQQAQQALRVIVDLTQEAQNQLNQIAQEPNANTQLKAQWQELVQQCYQREKLTQALRDQALSSDATKEDWYRYALHLLAYELYPKTDEKIVNHFLKAAQSGHEDAAVKLLEIYQPQVVRRALGDVFFQLSRLRINGQSPFIEEVRTEFLARAILALNRSALAYLNSKIQADIQQGVSRKDTDTKWQVVWVALGARLKELATTDETQREVQALIDDVNGMYQEKNAERKLALLSQMDDFPQSESDEESAPPPALEQVKVLEVLEDKNQRSELGEALQPVAERTLAEPEKDSTAKEEAAQETLSKEKSAPKTSKRESWAQPMAPPTLKPISKKDISQRDKPGLVKAPFAAHWLPEGFEALAGSQDRNSAEYNNFWHPIAGVHVGIAPFVYRVGAKARADLFEEYDVHALEVRDLSTYLAGVEASERSGLIARLAQGQPGPEGWQLPRAFVNAGEIQGFLMQKYLASRHENGRSVTATEGTEPLRLTFIDGYTRSKDMPGCQGELADAYVLAKQTSEVHQAASVFQYSALALAMLAQAQATGADPTTWHSHNDQANGIMGLGQWFEAAGGVTTASDDRGDLYVLGRDVDYTKLTKDTAFGSAKALQERGYEAVVWPYWQSVRLDEAVVWLNWQSQSVRLTGDFPLFSGDATFDALGLPKSARAQGKPWRGYGNSRLYLGYSVPNLMPVVGDWGSGGVVAGLCARHWDDTWNLYGRDAGLRLSAYGLTWTELAGASGGFGELPDDQAVKSREDKNQRSELGEALQPVAERTLAGLDLGWGKEEAAQETLSKEKSAPKTSKHESWAQPSEAKPMVPPTLKPISKKDISQFGEPGLVEAPFAAHWLPEGFEALAGSQDRNSAEYNNFWHPIAGLHVGIAPFVYRVGARARADLFEEYDVHALEVRDLSTYLAGIEASERSGLIARLAQGQPGFEGWQLPRAFVNAGEIQGFLMQKYLASRHENGRSVTATEGTEPLRLTFIDGYTRSKDMPGCRGELTDAYVLAKQTSEVHQVASVFQYSALALAMLAQAQATGADPTTWHSHNDQANGVMGLGQWIEAAGGVTSDDHRNLYVLGRRVDYTELTKGTAFGSAKALQEHGYEAVVCPDWRSVRLTGDFPLFSGDATFDALGLPKSAQAQGKPWRGYGNSELYLDPLPDMVPVVGDWVSGGVVAGLCARSWRINWDFHGYNAGLRLSAYGLTWTELAGASGAME